MRSGNVYLQFKNFIKVLKFIFLQPDYTRSIAAVRLNFVTRLLFMYFKNSFTFRS